MTSSLVGSEMCIRDRHQPRPIVGLGNVGAGLPADAIGHEDHRSRQPSPVSYTHLTLPTICSV
eukprot:6827088-Prorocentrum_lima.AAC.1